MSSRLRRAGATACTVLMMGALWLGCTSILPEPVRCSCDDIEGSSSCLELSGPAQESATYEQLCKELDDGCQGTYTGTLCPNPGRVAVCNRPRESFTESLVLYNIGGDPVQVGDDVSDACSGYGEPEYY